MKLLKDFEVNSAYGYFSDVEKVDKAIDEGISDEELIQNDLDKKYKEDKYFVLIDYIDDRNEGYFRIRVWEK